MMSWTGGKLTSDKELDGGHETQKKKCMSNKELRRQLSIPHRTEQGKPHGMEEGSSRWGSGERN